MKAVQKRRIKEGLASLMDRRRSAAASSMGRPGPAAWEASSMERPGGATRRSAVAAAIPQRLRPTPGAGGGRADDGRRLDPGALSVDAQETLHSDDDDSSCWSDGEVERPTEHPGPASRKGSPPLRALSNQARRASASTRGLVDEALIGAATNLDESLIGAASDEALIGAVVNEALIGAATNLDESLIGAARDEALIGAVVDEALIGAAVDEPLVAAATTLIGTANSMPTTASGSRATRVRSDQPVTRTNQSATSQSAPSDHPVSAAASSLETADPLVTGERTTELVSGAASRSRSSDPSTDPPRRNTRTDPPRARSSDPSTEPLPPQHHAARVTNRRGRNDEAASAAVTLSRPATAPMARPTMMSSLPESAGHPGRARPGLARPEEVRNQLRARRQVAMLYDSQVSARSTILR